MIAGICKVWNEEEILEKTLEHNAHVYDRLYVYDDCSTDGTREILSRWEQRDDVTVVWGTERHPSRMAAQGGVLQLILERAMQDNPEWIVQFDADEHIYLPQVDWTGFDGVRMKLFDFYITPDDVDALYWQRPWMGPEYRRILMMFRPFPGMAYGWRDQREMWGLPKRYRILSDGYVKHFGKAISVERWERKCDFYAKWPEPYKTKWINRRGKAVKADMRSDFGHDLIKWEDRDRKGFPLRD